MPDPEDLRDVHTVSAATLVTTMAAQAERRQQEIRRLVWRTVAVVTAVVVALNVLFLRSLWTLSDTIDAQSAALARRSVVLDYLTCRDARQTQWQAAILEGHADGVLTDGERTRIDVARLRLDQAERIAFAPGSDHEECRG